MSLQEHKLTDYAVSIAGLPDKIENKAQWLKQQFDARTDSEVRDKHNSLIDALDEDLAGRPTNESMASAIDEKVVELGAGDMAQGVYDPGHRRQDVFAYADAVRNYAQQVEEDSEQRDKGLKDYVDRISAGGESIKCGPAKTVTFTAGANRLESVAVSGFTTQTGTGDPAPDNVRPIQNAGMRNKLMTVTGDAEGLFMSTIIANKAVVFVKDAMPTQSPLCDRYKSNRATATDKTCWIDQNRNFGVTDSRFTSLEEARRILNEEPVTFAYQSTQDTGEYYTGLAVQQNGAYRCEIIRLADRLHAGDTLETNVQSEYDAYTEFDGSSDENWLLDSGSTAGTDGSKRMWIKLTGPQTENTSDQAVPVAASNQLTAQSAETTYIAKAANCFDVVYSGATNMLHVRIAGISTVEALKTHLQAHPLRVFYKSVSGGAGRLVRRETHTRKTLVLDGDAAKFTKAGSYWNLPNQSAPNVAAVPKCVCSSFPGSVFQANQTYNFLFAAQAQLTPYFDDLDACNAFLAQQYAAGTPVTIEYDLAAPEVYVDEPVQPQNPAGTCTLSGESGTRLTATVSPPVGCVNGKSGASVTLTKADIGLSNVDNTPDAQKNVKGLAVEQTDVITGLPTGLYYYKANTTGAPSTVDGLLLALVYMPFGVQLAFPTNSGVFFRWAVDNWSEWVRLDQ